MSTRSRWTALTAACLLAVLAAGCGSDSDEPTVEGPLPVGPDDAQAYTEKFLADNPRAELQPELLAIVRLEPTAADDDDTCAQRDGVDCLPYFVGEETVLTLAIDESATDVDRLVLRDGSGTAVLSLGAGGDPASAVIAPGHYILELVHVFAGDAGAETPTIFLRPGETAEGNEAATTAAEDQAGARPTTAPRDMTLTAGRDCRGCNFAKANLTDQRFDGANLSRSTFAGATFLRTVMRDTTLAGCTLTFLRAGSFDTAAGGNLTDRFDADFSGAKAAGVHFSFAVEKNYLGHHGFDFPVEFFGIFQGAMLDDTVWEQDTDPSGLASALRPDFRNASLRGATFGFIVLTAPAKCPAASRARPDACTFQGADLTGALFDDIFWNIQGTDVREFLTLGNNLAHCSFAIEPTSKRITVLRQVTMETGPQPTRRLDGSDFSGADLSGAYFEKIRFDDEIAEAGCAKQGANLAGANLSGTHFKGSNFSGASLAGAVLSGAILDDAIFNRANLSRATLTGAMVGGARWRGASLVDAVITGMIPPTFNGLDLTGTDLTGVDFAGFDLTRTDLSQATLSVPPRFAGAKLSDGTRGVNVAGHGFPPRYELFKGADLTGVDFSRTELFQANLEGTKLNTARLVGANLNFANLRGAQLRGATLGVQPGTEAKAATLHAAFMPDVDLSDADLRTVDMTGARIYSDQKPALLVRARLDSSNLSNAVCIGAQFSGSLNNASFVGTQLVNAVFNGATLTGTKFVDAYLQGADFSSASSVTGTVLSNAAISAAPGTWPFTESDGTPFVFRYEATKLGALATDRSVLCPNGASGPCCPSGDLVACLSDKLKPAHDPPYPPRPPCVPRGPCFENCLTPAVPSCTPRRPAPTRTMTPDR